MTASAFAGVPVEAAPFVVDADAAPQPPVGSAAGGVTLIALPNRHL